MILEAAYGPFFLHGREVINTYGVRWQPLLFIRQKPHYVSFRAFIS